MVSASSLTVPSQGLSHVNKIVKHLIWHLLPLNIHKPPSPGEHLLQLSSLTEFLRIWCARELPSGTWGKFHGAAFSETFMALTNFMNCLVCKQGWKPNGTTRIYFVFHVSKILPSFEGVSRKTCTFYLSLSSQPFSFPMVKPPNSRGIEDRLLFCLDNCDWCLESVLECEMGNQLSLTAVRKKIRLYYTEDIVLCRWDDKVKYWWHSGCVTCFHLLDIKLKVLLGDFPGGPVVKNLPANAGDMGLTPGPRRPHMSYGNEAHVPQLPKLHLEPMLCSKRSHHSEKLTHNNQSVGSPYSPRLQKAGAQQQKLRAAKNKNQPTNKSSPQILLEHKIRAVRICLRMWRW